MSGNFGGRIKGAKEKASYSQSHSLLMASDAASGLTEAGKPSI